MIKHRSTLAAVALAAALAFQFLPAAAFAEDVADCGDGVCDSNLESTSNCTNDCCVGDTRYCDPLCTGTYDPCVCDPNSPGCQYCGDGVCQPDLNETKATCTSDCCHMPEDECDPSCAAVDPCDEASSCYDINECCAGLSGEELACCLYPGTSQCDCYGLTGKELTCCQDPSEPSCQCDVCNPESDCYDFNDCCEEDACSDFACPGYCDEANGPCETDYCCESGQYTGAECPEICDDEQDNDENGKTDCADTNTGLDGCCADSVCENSTECNPQNYGCTDVCADNYDSEADGCEGGGDGCCEYGGGDAEEFSQCCDDGRDNDGDGDVDDEDYDCRAECQDVCATNYDERKAQDAAHDCDESAATGGLETCACEYDEEKLSDGCCEDSKDNDDDGTQDTCEFNDNDGDGNCIDEDEEDPDIDCAGGGGGTTCPYAYDYEATTDCGGVTTAFAGDISYEQAYAETVQCPSDAEASGAAAILAVDGIAAGGGLCNLSIGYLYNAEGGDSSYSWSFAFDLTERDVCPNIAGYQETLPPGLVQNAQGNCAPVACPDGDADGDLICEVDDPCDNVADSDLGDGLCNGAPCSPAAERALAGLVPTSGGNCSCGEFTRDLSSGSTGEDVGGLQDFLAFRGYLAWSDISARGAFGPGTLHALRAFQASAGLAQSGVLDAPTRAAVHALIGGPVGNGATYSAAEDECPVVAVDMCDNLDGDQDQAFLDDHPELQRLVHEGGDSWSCVCADNPEGGVDCPNNPSDYCIDEGAGECCNPEEFWSCPAASPETCISNEEDCNGSCRGGYSYCGTLRRCVLSSRYDAECVAGCFGTNGPSAGEYCAEIVTETGAIASPWRTTYPTETQLNAFFRKRNVTGAQTFSEALAAATAARTDGNPATPVYPVYGRVVSAGSSSCSAQVCNYGQECALYVRAGGQTSATCVDTICDPCDETLPACDPLNPPALGECCYDAKVCACDPQTDPLHCCQADPNKPGYNASCELAPRGVAIEVLPNLINQGDSCFVLWATQGMASTTVVGDGFGEGPNLALRHLSAGMAEVENVQISTLYKIVGTGTDGQTYEASDLCATNPAIREF